MAYRRRTEGFNPDSELSQVISELWDMDENKCFEDTDYVIDLQDRVRSTRSVEEDHAEDKLFSWVNPSIFERPTFKAFVALLDNYEMDVDAQENVTREEIKENYTFLEACLDTKLMKYAHSYLVSKGVAPEDEDEFKRRLFDIWFRMFKRGSSVKGSSSFEHVFVGETREDDMIGLHNWIQFYLQEKKGNIDYHGHFRRETNTEDENVRLLAVQFTWNGQKAKPMCSVFVGSSPEFELAAYTVCMFLDKDGDDKTDVQMGEYEVEVKVHSFGSGKYRKIGTAYIAAARMQQHGRQYYRRKR